LQANHPLPQMRISVLQDRDRFWTSPSSQGHPKPERSPEETGLLETSAAKPRDTAVTECAVDRPDVLRLRFEPRLRMGKARRWATAALHRDRLARKLSVPLFVFSGGNLLPNCGQSRIAMDQTAAARCTGCPVAAREPRSPVQGPQHSLASRGGIAGSASVDAGSAPPGLQQAAYPSHVSLVQSLPFRFRLSYSMSWEEPTYILYTIKPRRITQLLTEKSR